MGDQDELCNTRLGLALGFGDYVPKKMQKANKQPKFLSDLSFSLIPRQESAINMQLQANEPSKDSSFGISRDRSSTDYNCNAISGGLERERKKLRLSQEQLTLLEETFKLHTTLNLAQKLALAQQLNLKARQVEVWFQNRRARSKLKQTEVDCEFLKKYCERLKEENGRLKKELQELRSTKLGASQLYIQLPKAATLTICPSCDKTTRPAAAVEAHSPPQ
ncbi:homeobox-leucine zipper protein ATHB-4-like [Cucurbita pepo subsp. pepo]|uniref:homeobox-leucine zipper protein ATHB-4-like n=1 Tax=Cucurbita pepo subsp. pepo TaxID=3664 RepID=UPI000C9D6F62|nr:homeobox-leucine zipper protein ATHB-4-like [Cucurbita pepo subsp. pepo]